MSRSLIESARRPAIAVIYFAAVLANQSAPAASLRVVALSGRQAPGTAPGVLFQSFQSATINNSGRVAFTAQLAGVDVHDIDGLGPTNAEGIWSEGSGELRLVVREGDSAPGMPAETIFGRRYRGPSAFGEPAINDAGNVAFHTRYTYHKIVDGVEIDQVGGIWTGNADGVAHVAGVPGAAAGSAAPFGFIGVYSINDSGQVAFHANLTNRDRGVWIGDSSSYSPIALSGSQAPGTEPGVHFSSGDFDALWEQPVNDSGQVTFVSPLDGPGVDGDNDSGIWAGRAANLRLIAREGQQAPGLPAGTTFRQVNGIAFGIGDINKSGDVAFASSLSETDERGIFRERDGVLELVAASKMSVPGISESFVQYVGGPLLNDSGDVAYYAKFLFRQSSTQTGESILLDGRDGLRSIAISGQSSPGVQGFAYGNFRSFSLNSSGQVAFQAHLKMQNTTKEGIFATDQTGAVRLVAANGMQIEVGPREFKTIESVTEFRQSRGSFNDRGQVLFLATFRGGGSGVFVSDVVAVPEPTGFLLLMGASLAAVRRRSLSL